MNRAAASVLAERDGLRATHNCLRAELAGEATRLARTIQQAASTSNGRGVSAGGTVLVSRRTRPPIRLLVSPIHNSVLPAFQKIAAVVFINDPLRNQRPGEALLRMIYGLTPAECRVALMLSDGHAPRKIAQMLGVTDNTVRSQIQECLLEDWGKATRRIDSAAFNELWASGTVPRR